MATYPGMTLRGEVRESVSLDEDDLSDVEDEVFIRDGKHGYKFAEEVGVKRPLMAPRKKVGRPDITSRLRNKQTCKALCKPCCYVLAALTVLIGLMVLIVILVSMFPLPVDKLKSWILNKTGVKHRSEKPVPCSEMKVTDVWTINLPKLTSESPIRTLDINNDEIEDIIFGFGTGDNTNTLQPDIFCPIFMGVVPPCEGGLIALDGTNGNILWRHWMNDTVFSLTCAADVNGDGLFDCLAVGYKGTLCMIDSRNGSVIWQKNSNTMDIYMSNFVPDQDNDTIPDVLTSYSQYKGGAGNLILISGRTGKELQRLSTQKTFFLPQIFLRGDEFYVLFGTGSPTTPGNLSVISLRNLTSGNMTSSSVIYEDAYKGMLTQSVLVDITGDNQTDIVTAMFNSTVVAIDGKTLKQLWNYSIPNSESLVIPTPGFFNDDNVTDFLVVYKTGYDENGSELTKTYILDGRTGKPIYEKPINNTVYSQMGALTLQMNGKGLDMFLFWTAECAELLDKNIDKGGKNVSSVKTSCFNLQNSSYSLKLNAMNQFDQPPGFEIFNSEKHVFGEKNGSLTPLEQAIAFLQQHPEKLQASDLSTPMIDDTVDRMKYKQIQSSFRRKNARKGSHNFVKNSDPDNIINEQVQRNIEQEYDQPAEDINNLVAGNINPPQDMNYDDYIDDPSIYDPKLFLNDRNLKLNNRDPRSKEDINEKSLSEAMDAYDYSTPTVVAEKDVTKRRSQKKNLQDSVKYGIYDYKNVKNARSRLLHDLTNLPNEILRDTFFKNRERQLRKSRFEQRDLKSHNDRMKENEEVRNIIEKEKEASLNTSETLWDLESEKEVKDRENGYVRGKREANFTASRTANVLSVGAFLKPINSTNNTIDLIFFINWSSVKNVEQKPLEKLVEKCIKQKTEQGTIKGQEADIRRTCINEYKTYERDFPYFDEVSSLRLGQITVYRIRVQCVCRELKNNQKCAKLLQVEDQGWASYLGKFGNGLFSAKN